jgi:protein O-mannosyl-transferase
VRSRVLPGLLLAALIAFAYGPSVRNELVFDELIFVEKDPRVHDFEVKRIFLEALWSNGARDDKIHQYYRPLQLLPLAVSYRFFGSAAWPNHVLSLALHLSSCLLVLGIYRLLLGAELPAALAVAVFAIHPGYSEAVLWISDVAGLGAAFCTLALFRLHLSPRRDRWYGWLLAPFLLLCGLWFKESGVLPLALLPLYDVLAAQDRGPRRGWRMRWRYIVLLPPLAVYLAMRIHALGGFLPGLETVPMSRLEMIANAVGLLPDYVSTFFWPFDPNMYHDFDAVKGLADPRLLAGAAVLATGAALAALSVRSHRVFAFGLAWAFVAAAPHLLVRWPQLNVFAERYLYLPSVGLFLSFGYAVAMLRPRLGRLPRRLLVGVASALVVLFLLVDVRRTGDWRDEVTIYEKTLRQSKRAELIRTNLAVRYLDLGRYDEGIAVLEPLLAIDPSWHETRHNLGLLYMAKGENAKAIGAFEEAVRRDPFKDATLLNLGYLYDLGGHREDAVRTYLTLVERQPDNTSAWYNLATIAFEEGQLDNARKATEQVLAHASGDAEALRLLDRIDRSARRQPVRPHADGGATLERCERAKRLLDAGHRREAIALLDAAAWLDERSPLPHHYLANIHYLAGHLARAAQHQREAVRLAPGNDLYRRNLEALEKAMDETKGRGTRNENGRSFVRLPRPSSLVPDPLVPRPRCLTLPHLRPSGALCVSCSGPSSPSSFCAPPAARSRARAR